jgi:plasmid maintenance system antidote protein VapI
MEEKQDRRFRRERIIREVHIQRLDVLALLSRGIVSPDVFFGRSVQFWGEFQTQYPLKRVLGL